MQDSAGKITVGSQVWVENPSVAWIDGEVLKIDGTEAEIRTTDGKKVSQPIICSCQMSIWYFHQFHHFIYHLLWIGCYKTIKNLP